MAERRAIELALDLSRMPALAPMLRCQTPPPDILDAIRAAAGCPEALQAACSSTREPLHVIQRAAALYLQETLFFPGASLHRNLGVTVEASRTQMRLHMRWLMIWLHPDHNSDEMAKLLAARVIDAWRELGRRKAQIKKAPVGTNKVPCSAKTCSAELKRLLFFAHEMDPDSRSINSIDARSWSYSSGGRYRSCRYCSFRCRTGRLVVP